MELKEFVSQTLIEIFGGVELAQKELGASGIKINPYVYESSAPQKGSQTDGEHCPIGKIDFDIAVTASDGSGTKAKIGVLSGLIGASLEGAGEKQRESINRIKFSVPMSFSRSKPA